MADRATAAHQAVSVIAHNAGTTTTTTTVNHHCPPTRCWWRVGSAPTIISGGCAGPDAAATHQHAVCVCAPRLAAASFFLRALACACQPQPPAPRRSGHVVIVAGVAALNGDVRTKQHACAWLQGVSGTRADGNCASPAGCMRSLWPLMSLLVASSRWPFQLSRRTLLVAHQAVPAADRFRALRTHSGASHASAAARAAVLCMRACGWRAGRTAGAAALAGA